MSKYTEAAEHLGLEKQWAPSSRERERTAQDRLAAEWYWFHINQARRSRASGEANAERHEEEAKRFAWAVPDANAVECEVCGTSFVPKRSTTTTCSKQCYQRSYKRAKTTQDDSPRGAAA